MAYTRTTEQLTRQIRADLARVTDRQVRDLVAAWVNAWNEVSPDLNSVLLEMLTAGENVTRTQLLRSTRLQKALALIRDNLEQLAADGRLRIVGDIAAVLDIAGGAQASVIDSQLPAQARDLVDLDTWSRVDERSLKAIVTRSTKQITSRFKPLPREVDLAVKRELIRGYASGSNPRVTASRIMARTEGKFNGGLTRALAIARTETLDASRAGAHLGRLQHADVLAGWAWHCELTTRSCQACIAMDGTVFPLDAPGPNDHVNGRCTGVAITKPWSDLGLDIAEPAASRIDGAAWFEAQSAQTQREILGPAKYEAWKAGEYPVSAWGEMRTNDGWRDSLQQTNAPQPAQSGGRRAAS